MTARMYANIKRNYPDLIDAIKEGTKYQILVYDKKHHYENDPDGDGYVTYEINPKHFDNNVKEIYKALEEVRLEVAIANKKYKPHTINVIGKSMRGIRFTIDSIKHESNFKPFQDGMATTMAIIGSSKTGKSTLFRYIFIKYYEPMIKLMSFLYTGSKQIDIYKRLKRLDIIPFFNSECEDLIGVQRYINQETNNHYNFLNIFDDILNLRYKKLIEELVCKDRNSNISSIISIQDFTMIPPSIRNNVNSFALFKPNTEERNAKFIINLLKPYFLKILGKDASLDDMSSFFNSVTERYGFIYIIPSRQHISFHRLNLNDIRM
jgi:hypothetical protein